MSDDQFDRVPPQDIDAEMSVLGSMMLTTEAANVVSEMLRGQDFYQPSHDAAGAYPIVLVSYLAARLRYDDARIAAVVKAYLRFAASTRGQDASTKATGCAPITRQMREKINAAIDKIAA